MRILTSAPSHQPMLLSLNLDTLFQLALALESLSALGNLARTCLILRAVALRDVLWGRLVLLEVGVEGVAQLASLASRIGWRELYRRMRSGDECGWRQVSSKRCPHARAGHAAAVLNGQLVLYGGEGGGDIFLGDTWIGEFQDGLIEWKQVAENAGPPPRVAMSVSVVNEKIYLFGGGAEYGKFFDDTWCGMMDTEQQFRWRQVALQCERRPPARDGHTTCVFHDQIVLYGGEAEHKLGDTWLGCTHPDGDLSWLSCTGVAPEARWQHSFNMLGQVLVLFGGETDTGCVNDTWICTVAPHQACWKIAALNGPSPPCRSSHSATSIMASGRLIIFGGENYHNGVSEYRHDTWSAHVVKEEVVWSELMPVSSLRPPPRAGGARVVGNHLIVFGGDNLQKEGQEVLGDTWIGLFNQDSIDWKEISCEASSKAPSGRYGYSSNVLDGSIILFGGVGVQEQFFCDTFALSLWGS